MQDPHQFYFRLFSFWLVILLILIPISLTAVQARGIQPAIPQQEKTEEAPSSDDDGRLPSRTTQPPPPPEVIPPTHPPTIFKEATATPTFTQTIKSTPSPSATLEQETEEVPSSTATEQEITESPETGQGEPVATEYPPPEPSITETVFDADLTATSQVIIPSGPTKTPTIHPQSEEPLFSQEEILLGVGVTAGVVIAGLGAGIGILLVNRRKKKTPPLFAEDCEAIRARNKKLLKKLKEIGKQAKKAQRDEQTTWDKYRKLLRQPIIDTDEAIQALEAQRKRIYEQWKNTEQQYRRTLNSQGLGRGAKARLWRRLPPLYLDMRRKAAIIERQINKLKKQGHIDKKRKIQARENARTASRSAAAKLRHLYKQQFETLRLLRDLFAKFGHCKDCCELEKIVADLKEQIKDLEAQCKKLEKEQADAEKREKHLLDESHQATRAAAKGKGNQDPQKAYQEAKQKLIDFINRSNLKDIGATTDLTEAKKWNSYIGEDVDQDVLVYARDYTAWRTLRDYLQSERYKIKQLRQELQRARQMLKERDKSIEAGNRDAKRKYEMAKDANSEKKLLRERQGDCKRFLQELEELLNRFEELLKKCVKDLKDCRDRVRTLNEQVKELLEKLNKCKAALRRNIQHLKALQVSLKKLKRKYPSLHKKYKEVRDAIEKAEICLKDLNKLKKPKPLSPGKGKCGKLIDCEAKVKQLQKDIAELNKSLNKCQGCQKKSSVVIPALAKAIAQELDPEASRRVGDYCCPNGFWIGVGVTTGVGLLIWGYQKNKMLWFCSDDTDKWARISSSSHRFGLTLGFEAGAMLGLVWEADHPHEALEVWKNQIMTGMDFDLSLGIPVVKLLKKLRVILRFNRLKFKNKIIKTALKGLEKFIGILGTQIKKVPSKGRGLYQASTDLALSGASRAAGSVLKKGAKGALKSGGKGAAKSAKSRALALPLTYGLQVGLWKNIWAKLRVDEFRCCSCNIEMGHHLDSHGHFHK